MITYIIIGITVLVSLLAFSNEKLMSSFMFNAYAIDKRKQYYRFISSGLIHADIFHLFFNMYALYLFGGIVESKLIDLFGVHGLWIYFLLYISALVMSSTFSFYKHKENPSYKCFRCKRCCICCFICQHYDLSNHEVDDYADSNSYFILHIRTTLLSLFLLYG